jgi:hypothetical protein
MRKVARVGLLRLELLGTRVVTVFIRIASDIRIDIVFRAAKASLLELLGLFGLQGLLGLLG